MKKILGVIIFALSGFLVTAQTPDFTIGPKAGASFSSFSTEQDQIESEVRSSLNFGAFVRFGNKVYLQPELMFMNRKGDITRSDLFESNKSIHLKTLDIPVLIGAKVIDTKVFNIRILAGPVASLALNRDITTDNWETGITSDDIRSANWGIQAGAGVDFLMLTFDLKYEFGISDFSKYEGLTLKNNMFVVGLGWKIL
ncbi:MAG: porin family protein [Lentimicrobium sp.]|jgi:hypothetical protein|nr:porin family protein [Lentimicrobium sp.]